jgi:hypothetical protein
LKVNNAGSTAPAETGLIKNSLVWQISLEMVWWHGVHFGMWNRWNEVDKMLNVYKNFYPHP